jgi:hypothetical protein
MLIMFSQLRKHESVQGQRCKGDSEANEEVRQRGGSPYVVQTGETIKDILTAVSQ